MKIFKDIQQNKVMRMPIRNPFNPLSLVFLLFDLFKNFYTNFLSKVTFTFPKFRFDDSIIPHLEPGTIEANFTDMKIIYAMELGKPGKMSHKLNEKVLNPAVIERVNVKLADSVFHSSTIKA